MSPNVCVRLRHAYVIRCDRVVKDADGAVVELECTWFPESKSGGTGTGPKARGTIHWVEADTSVSAEVRLYERLFVYESPGTDFLAQLNPNSKVVMPHSRIEPSVLHDPPDQRYQFTRLGYFWRDPVHRTDAGLIFNRIAPLRDSWTKAPTSPVPTKASAENQNQTAATPQPELLPADQAWVSHHGLSAALGWALLRAPGAREFFDTAASTCAPQPLANWLVNQLLPAAKDRALSDLPFDAPAFGRLVTRVTAGEASSHQAREVLVEMIRTGKDPDILLEARKADTLDKEHMLYPVIDQLLQQYPDKVTAYQNGKKGLLGFFVGQGMKETRGAAPPQLLRTLLEKRLG